MGLPLDNVLVVALEQAVAAPLCTSRLADAGARVIKVERPEGDFARSYDQVAAGESAYFVWINRGKESICLDIKEANDATLLQRILLTVVSLMSCTLRNENTSHFNPKLFHTTNIVYLSGYISYHH